jgi:hypothetical protein
MPIGKLVSKLPGHYNLSAFAIIVNMSNNLDEYAHSLSYQAKILKNYASVSTIIHHLRTNTHTLGFNSTQAFASTTQLYGFPWKSQLTNSSCSTIKTPFRTPSEANSSCAMISSNEVSCSRFNVRSTRDTLFLSLYQRSHSR